MHKQRLNEALLDFVIEPVGPILIKSGQQSGANPTLPDMNFVRTRHAALGETIYLPGASLKGVIRSHTERIIRTVLGESPEICCDPFSDKACGVRLAKETEKLSTAKQYGRLCLACKIFGHTVQAGRLSTQDAYPLESNLIGLETRYGVAIDRRSGGVAVGPFEMEVAISGRFVTRLRLHNFERWQVGLLALVLRDLSRQELPLGFGKSRGLGRVMAHYQRLSLAYPGRFGHHDYDFANRWYGVGAFGHLDKDYKFQPADSGDLPEALRGNTLQDEQWGKPTLLIGDQTLDRAYSQLPPIEATAAHQAVETFLADAVHAWAAFVSKHQQQAQETDGG